MDFNFTDEQRMLRDSLTRYLADNYSFKQRLKVVRSEPGWRPQCWKDFAELGLLGASFPEAVGGLGGSAIETMVVMEEFGKALVIEPYLGTAVIAGGLLKRCDSSMSGAMLEQIATGEAVFAFAHTERNARSNLAALSTTARRSGNGYVLSGAKSVVIGAPWASHYIVTARTAGGERDRDGLTVFLLDSDAEGIARSDYVTVDGSRSSEIRLDGVALSTDAVVGGVDQGFESIERVVDEANVALCAEALGIMTRLLEDSVNYARQRKQFGVPIGSFQVLRHRLADMWVGLQQCISLTYVATMKLDTPDRVRGAAVSAAKVLVGRTVRSVAQSAVQIHGAIGTSEELALGHYFKRATVIESQFGSVDHHLRRYSQLTARYE